MRKRFDNTKEDFYIYMGNIFGSRKIQKETQDRFYDDQGKEWIININEDSIDSIVSIKGNRLKNVYSDNDTETIDILKEIYDEVQYGAVPAKYKELYLESGYRILSERVNFIKIEGGFSEKDKV